MTALQSSSAYSRPQLRGVLLHDAPLAEYTSWRVGGPAEHLYRPADIEDLSAFLQMLSEDEPLTWLGLGSNVLVRDQGIKGTVIVTQGALKNMSILADDILYAEAGVACGQVARFAARSGLSGIEFFAGIPGTVGGALAMNAGAYGGETWLAVKSVEVINRQGIRLQRQPAEYEIAYRHVKRPTEEWFVAGTFQLQPGDKEMGLQTIREMLEKRNASQPINLPNCGSVFRNPPGNYAARLIEQCGLKGFKIGAASVSTKHANFIINEGAATAKDIEQLIMHIAATVEEKHGIKLIREVHILGN